MRRANRANREIGPVEEPLSLVLVPPLSVSERLDLSATTASTLAAIFSALGEPTRLRILHALFQGELCVGELATTLTLAVPIVSQHLRVLRTLRIVRNRRAGKLIYYTLDDEHVADLFAVALAHVEGGERS